MRGAALIAESFGRRYRRNRPWAVRAASFSIPEGSITALVGPNGSGKSTLIRACIGFERPDEGRILVSGVDPTADRTRAVNSIGYVAQSAALYRNLTIGDHIDFAAAARRRFSRPDAIARIRAAGLSEDRSTSTLSGGERAQVALALALGTRAPLLLLDEPMASLDPLARRDFINAFVKDVRGRGVTAVLSSHIVADMEQACDRLLVLLKGQVILNDSVDAVKIRFRLLPAPVTSEVRVVGTFADSGGALMALVDDATRGRPASIEEIVLGHLATDRDSPTTEVA
jgi:ABC-2 type transport system ATP-binding protein